MLQVELNFTYKIYQPEQKNFGVLINGTWTGIIGELYHKEADFTISDLSVTASRAAVVDFSLGIYEEANKLFIKMPKQSVSWTTFVDVFAIEFSMALVGLFVGLTLIFYIIFWFVNNETTIGLGKSVSTVFLSFLALSIPVEPNRVPGRVLVFSVCLSGAVVFWSYNAGLVSLLTVDTIVFPIK